MKTYFDDAVQTAVLHAYREYPKESIGVVVSGTYIPLKNISNEPDTAIISPDEFADIEDIYGEVECIIHSHDDYPHASKTDMEQQLLHGVPWGIINVKNKKVEDVFFWGDSLPIQDYVGRKFYHGVYDCFSCARDYYRGELGIQLPMVPREYKWWLNGENLIEENMLSVGFEIIGGPTDVKLIQPNDGILARINSNVINHTGVYIDNGLLLHHLCLHKNNLSKHDPLNVYRDYIQYIVRYKEFL